MLTPFTQSSVRGSHSLETSVPFFTVTSRYRSSEGSYFFPPMVMGAPSEVENAPEGPETVSSETESSTVTPAKAAMPTSFPATEREPSPERVRAPLSR